MELIPPGDMQSSRSHLGLRFLSTSLSDWNRRIEGECRVKMTDWPVVTRFFWPPETPRCNSSPTCISCQVACCCQIASQSGNQGGEKATSSSLIWVDLKGTLKLWGQNTYHWQEEINRRRGCMLTLKEAVWLTMVSEQMPSPSILMMNSVMMLVLKPSRVSAFMRASTCQSGSMPISFSRFRSSSKTAASPNFSSLHSWIASADTNCSITCSLDSYNVGHLHVFPNNFAWTQFCFRTVVSVCCLLTLQ